MMMFWLAARLSVSQFACMFVKHTCSPAACLSAAVISFAGEAACLQSLPAVVNEVKIRSY